MSTIITAQAKPVKIQFKQAGKLYNTTNVEAGGSPDPFDEVTIQPGEAWTLPEGGTLIGQSELGDANEQGGTPDDNRGGGVRTPGEGGIATPIGGTPD